MDKQRAAIEKPRWKKYWFFLLLFSLVIGIYLLTSFLGNASYFIERNSIVTATVEQGDFRVNVRATGVLKPLNIRWVSSQVSGRVEQVLVKAGAVVNKGDVLAQLSNPELHRNLDRARWELKAIKAETHVAFVILESQMVDLENAVLSAKYSFQSAKLKLDAEQELIAQGNATVSKLEYKRSQLAVKQQRQYWHAQQQKHEKMKVNMTATKMAQQARIGLVENNFQRVQAQVSAMKIRSSITGVVQQVSLELGERAQVGDSVALVAEQNTLFVELQVHEVRVSDIRLGQQVAIDMRTSEIAGEVMRIDPAVKGGMVRVDVKLINELPDEARPELTVDGLITISHIENARYVKRPVYAAKNSQIGLYKLSKNKQFASKQLVALGQSSVNNIQIFEGLMVGDEIIISDTSSWQQHQEIKIN